MARFLDRIAPDVWARLTIVIGLVAILGLWVYIWMHPKHPPPMWPGAIGPLVQAHDVAGLTAAIDDPNIRIAISACHGLVVVEGKEARAKMEELLLKDPRSEIRQEAATLLSRAGEPTHEEALRHALLHDATSTVRAAAARSLGNLGGIDPPPGIDEAMNDNNSDLFKELCSQTSAADLLDAMDDPDLYVRQCAHKAYQKILICVILFKEDEPEAARQADVQRFHNGLTGDVKGWLIWQEQVKKNPGPPQHN